ncbi:maturation protein [ssRNA phage SRR5467091_9]|uniref:Maturation protein n=1 Tax=ssRNA phage SRR5467091_9 TaxID=2786474 RepID=A0A8S5KZV1_9VIRU|nr:maturation protein [ssRNA phage SRR5467091_9]DAD50913.1 TPA_asm: maturation protein [ssRNA phage SRR5467091_9]
MGRTRETVQGSLDHPEIVTYDGSHYLTTYTGKQETKRIEDTVTPGYHSLKKCGKYLPFNSVLITTDTIEHIAGPVVAADITATPPHLYRGMYYEHSSHLIPEPTPSSSLTDAAVISAAANAASAVFDVLTWIAEINETVSTLHQIFRVFNQRTRLMAELAAEFRRQNRYGRARSAFDIFTELWLLGRFGVRPLFYDAMNVSQALALKLAKDLMVDGHGHQGESLDDEVDTGFTDYNIWWKRRIKTTLRGTFEHRGWAMSQFSSANAKRWGFDPFVTAWEKVPYSFVVDEFINIGGWIRTLIPSLKGEFRGIGMSLKASWVLETELTYIGQSGYSSGSWGPCITRYTRERYIREPTTIPFPPLLPQLSLPRLVDLVALVAAGRQRVSQILARADRNAAWSQNQGQGGGIGAGNY